MKKIFKRSLLAAIVVALGETDLPARADGPGADEEEGEDGGVAQKGSRHMEALAHLALPARLARLA